MSDIIKNRSEILFLYDVVDSNPNGDPMEENRPRIDAETGINIVTDVRLKRTIRDYLRDYKGQNIFIQAEKVVEEGTELLKARGPKLVEEIETILLSEEGNEIDEIKGNLDKILQEGSKGNRKSLFNEKIGKSASDEKKEELFARFEEIRTKELREKLFEKFIDLRLFGATIAVSNMGVQETGPVQFKFGRSLHKVDMNFYKGSLTMPVEPAKGFKKGKKQAEFSEEYKVPYSLICFYGIANENSAKNTSLSEDDIKLLLDGIWNGTKNLITRSKVGQMPRFLLRIVYNKDNFHIGELDKLIKIDSNDGKNLNDEKQLKIRDISDVVLDISDLISVLNNSKDKIALIEFKADYRLKFKLNGQYIGFKRLKTELLRGIELRDENISELKF